MSAVLSAAAFAFYANRPPTPAEQKVISRYAATMNKVLDQFRGPDWAETLDHAIDHPNVTITSDRPLDIDEVLQRSYNVKPGSKRDRTLVQARLQKMSAEKDLTKKSILQGEAEDLMHLQVQVHFNMLVVPMITGPDAKIDPKVPGTVFVHQDRNNPFSHGVAYVLFFSNGRKGRWEEVNDVYRNFFIHKPGTPFIENIEVRIFGSEDRIKELLRTVDWNQVNAALTNPAGQPPAHR
jgi:hypothetical protein